MGARRLLLNGGVRVPLFPLYVIRSTLVRMSVVGHGMDLVECARIARMIADHGDRFLHRVYTAAEREVAGIYRDPTPFYAGRWAAKEAILKMIGTGWRGRIAWTDMEILPDALGRPVVTLHGETARRAAELGIARTLLTITHTGELAAASVMGMASSQGEG